MLSGKSTDSVSDSRLDSAIDAAKLSAHPRRLTQQARKPARVLVGTVGSSFRPLRRWKWKGMRSLDGLRGHGVQHRFHAHCWESTLDGRELALQFSQVGHDLVCLTLRAGIPNQVGTRRVANRDLDSLARLSDRGRQQFGEHPGLGNVGIVRVASNHLLQDQCCEHLFDSPLDE